MVRKRRTELPRGPAPRATTPQQYPGGPMDQPQHGRGSSQQQQTPRGTARPVYAVGPSMTPTPELHQATQAPHQPGVAMQPPAEVGSSSSQPPPVHEEMAQLSIWNDKPHVQATPASSKSMRFPLRPGKGIFGTRKLLLRYCDSLIQFLRHRRRLAAR